MSFGPKKRSDIGHITTVPLITRMVVPAVVPIIVFLEVFIAVVSLCVADDVERREPDRRTRT